MKKLTMLGLLALFVTSSVTPALAYKLIPQPRQQKSRSLDPLWDGAAGISQGVPMYSKQGSLDDTVWVHVKDDSSCSFTGDPLYGSRGERTPGWSVWCFDGGAGDSCSNTTRYGVNSPAGRVPGCWTHYDAHIFGQTNKWHIDTYDVYLPASEDSSMWCGEDGDTLSWEWPPGYGPGYNFSLILNLGNSSSFNTANGCSVGGVHLFAIELAYDYCFVEMAASGTPDTAIWREIARFNGVSNPDSVNCRGLGGSYWGDGIGGSNNSDKPYLCADWTTFEYRVTQAQLIALGQNGAENLFVRWRVYSDFLWDDLTGEGTNSDTRGAWRVDHMYVKGNNSPNSYFPAGGAVSRNPAIPSGNVDWETLAEDGRSSFSTQLLPRAEAAGGYWGGGAWVHGRSRVVDLWHLTNTPSYTNQGNTCETTNRWIWASNLTPGGIDGNIEDNGFLYRLASPTFDVSPTSALTAGTPLAGGRVSGAIVMYDDYLCIKQISEDVTTFVGRVYIGPPQSSWNQWEYAGIFFGGCQFWSLGDFDDWSSRLNNTTDSLQVGYDMFDQCDYNSATPADCMPGIIVANPHRKNTFLFDNFSVGFFKQENTIWGVGSFQDTFARDVYVHPVAKENWELFPGDTRQDEDSVAVTLLDFNGVAQNSVVMHYRVSTDCGSTWTHESSRPQGSKAKPAIEWFTKSMNFSEPDEDAEPGTPTEFNGTYRSTIELNTTDLPGSILDGSGFLRAGTVIEYYYTGRDRSVPAIADTVPNRHTERRTFIHPMYGAERQDPWPLEVTVLPCLPAAAYTPQGGKKILLINDYAGRNYYDPESDPTLAGLGTAVFPRLSQAYEEALRDLNLKFDRYDNDASFFVRGSDLPFYSEPTDPDGFGGIRDPGSSTHRYQDLIWPTHLLNQFSVTDSSQLEVAAYLASDVNEGNLWLGGRNLCEDEKLSGISEHFAGVEFWVNYVGATLLSGGCPDNAGLVDKRFYIEGVNNAGYTQFAHVGGWADCPTVSLNQPDDGMTMNGAGQGTEQVIFQFDNLAHTLNKTSGIRNVQPGAPNKMVTTTFGLGDVTTRAARACLTRAILADFGITMPAGSKYTLSVCANSATDVPGGSAQRKFELAQNYPNPFTPGTTINYSLPKDNMKVELAIFDVSGREVVKLVNRVESGPVHEVFWNGKNTAGQDVASGVYFYKLVADDQQAVKKMVFIK